MKEQNDIINKLSAVLIVKNEELNLERCLNSISFADEIIILDTGSNDNTISIAKKFTLKVFSLSNWTGFGNAKREAVSYASNDWVFSLDADEVVSKELADEIISILSAPTFMLYRIKRKSFYLGKLIEHCGWQNDYPKRLFNKKFANFNDKLVHESVVGVDEIGTIESPLYHYTYSSISTHLKKIDFYTELAANSSEHSNATSLSILLRGAVKFVKMYILQGGFRDGKAGFVLSLISSFGVMIKYLKIMSKRI